MYSEDSETTASDGTGSRERSDNELIAEFMGVKPWSFTNMGGQEAWKVATDHYYTTNWGSSEAALKKFYEEASYARSWDWLMPVVEKIEDSGFQVEILHNETAIRQGMTLRTIVLTGDKTKIASVYSAVVEFIKWYNTTQKQQAS